MVTLAGTVETFDAANFTLHLATLVGVEPAAITLNVTAASVRVAATIRVVGEAVNVVASVQALSSNASALSLAAGVTVESVAIESPPPSSPPPPSPFAPPSSLPPSSCANVTLPTTGWQMISFNCIGNMSNTFNVLESVTWGINDKIMTRDPFLKFATFDGVRLVGSLVASNQLSMSLGYKILYSGAPGAVIEQTGLPQLPVENVVLWKGWNWIGHAPLHTYDVNAIKSVEGTDFSVNDQIKTRAGSVLKLTTHNGGSGASVWQGNVPQLMPGIGYQIKVAQAVTFCYGKLCDTA